MKYRIILLMCLFLAHALIFNAVAQVPDHWLVEEVVTTNHQTSLTPYVEECPQDLTRLGAKDVCLFEETQGMCNQLFYRSVESMLLIMGYTAHMGGSRLQDYEEQQSLPFYLQSMGVSLVASAALTFAYTGHEIRSIRQQALYNTAIFSRIFGAVFVIAAISNEAHIGEFLMLPLAALGIGCVLYNGYSAAKHALDFLNRTRQSEFYL